MSNPLVSIIICTYNRSQFLSQTLDSVFGQSYSPVEIIIVDDGSTDDTEEIIKSFEHKISYHKKKNEGIAKSRSFGGRVARGEFIAYQDDDDIMPAGRISILYETLRLFPSAVFATGDLAIIDEKGTLTGHRWLPEDRYGKQEPILFEDGYEAVMWPRVPVAPHTTLFKRIDGEKVGWFDEQFTISEDKDFFARLGRLGSVVYIPKIVSLYRRGHNSLTNHSISTSYKKLKLFEAHLNHTVAISQKMRNRLQQRMLIELKNIARSINDGNPLPDAIPQQYLSMFLSKLETNYRYKYLGYKYLKLPLRSIINKLR